MNELLDVKKFLIFFGKEIMIKLLKLTFPNYKLWAFHIIGALDDWQRDSEKRTYEFARSSVK